MSDSVSPADELDLQAAEYVLGTLTPAEARALEALALTDPAVAAGLAAWEDRLSPLAALVDPVSPPPMLWRRLALATGLEPIIHAPMLPRRSAAKRAWRSAGVWRGMTAGATAIAACLAILLLTRPAAGPEPLVAALTPYNQPGATFLVRVGADGLATVVAVADTNVPAGRSLELWSLPTGATVPVSMGLLPSSGRARLPLPMPPGTQLLVSQEPAGGSPTKLPTGPVVLAGKLTGI